MHTAYPEEVNVVGVTARSAGTSGLQNLEVAMRQREFLKGILGSCACETVDLVRLT